MSVTYLKDGLLANCSLVKVSSIEGSSSSSSLIIEVFSLVPSDTAGSSVLILISTNNTYECILLILSQLNMYIHYARSMTQNQQNSI